MKAVVPVLAFLARHILFVVFATIVGCLVWTIVYLVLLATALFTQQGVGGPLAYPAGILFIVVACVVFGWGVFAPASATGAVFCGILSLPRVAAIPVVWAAALGFGYLNYWAYVELVTTQPMPSASTVLTMCGIYLSLPLGVYWWLTEGPGALFDLLRRWLRGRHRSESTSRPAVAPDQ